MLWHWEECTVGVGEHVWGTSGGLGGPPVLRKVAKMVRNRCRGYRTHISGDFSGQKNEGSKSATELRL